MSGGIEFQFLLISSVFLSTVYFCRFRESLLRFYFCHRTVIAALLSLGAATFLRRSVRKVQAWHHNRKGPESFFQPSHDEDAVFAGLLSSGKPAGIRHSYRTMHAQVIGTTNAGKTESVIIPWAVDDIKNGRGVLIIDGKSDRSLLDKLWAYTNELGRQADFRILSICEPAISNSLNPFSGGNALELTERFFKAFDFENEFYKDIQYDVLLHTLLVFEETKGVAAPIDVVRFLRDVRFAKELSERTSSGEITAWITDFLKLPIDEREKRTMGLVTKLQTFCVGELSAIFNERCPEIDLDIALQKNLIVYCQLPVLKIPVLGKSIARMVLQALQSAIASRQLSNDKTYRYFSVYLDDFTEYLTEGFVSTLNKSRSAKVMVTFAHQAIGDLSILGDSVQNAILTNANLKVFMRTNEPSSAEYFASVVGTSETEKVTERQTRHALGSLRTGEGSVREVEEFRFHPNLFKSGLGTGEAVVVVPHSSGSAATRIKFAMLPDLPAVALPQVKKRSHSPSSDEISPSVTSSTKSSKGYTANFIKKEAS